MTTQAAKWQKAATPPFDIESDCTSLGGNIDDDMNLCILSHYPVALLN